MKTLYSKREGARGREGVSRRRQLLSQREAAPPSDSTSEARESESESERSDRERDGERGRERERL